MPKAKVVYIGTLNPRRFQMFVESTPEEFLLVTLPQTSSPDEMIREIKDADFLIPHLGRRRLPDEVCRAGKHLKLIQLTGSGDDSLPLPLLRDLGIPVANVGGGNAISVAEHAVTLMLMVLRRVVPSMMALRQGKWRVDLDDTQYAELYQKTVGIVGLGNQGRWVGRITSGFGAQVIFCNTSKIRLTMAGLIPSRQVALDELLRTADVVTLHVPLKKNTVGLIGRRELELMKPSAILINTCRGPVVDEVALINALRKQHIAGAGLDVFEHEPIDLDNPLLHMEQVVCTPHMGGAGREKLIRSQNQVWGNLKAVLRGDQPDSLVSTPQ